MAYPNRAAQHQQPDQRPNTAQPFGKPHIAARVEVARLPPYTCNESARGLKDSIQRLHKLQLQPRSPTVMTHVPIMHTLPKRRPNVRPSTVCVLSADVGQKGCARSLQARGGRQRQRRQAVHLRHGTHTQWLLCLSAGRPCTGQRRGKACLVIGCCAILCSEQ
jgi:hypothetical protein